jgi:hypothetical protein
MLCYVMLCYVTGSFRKSSLLFVLFAYILPHILNIAVLSFVFFDRIKLCQGKGKVVFVLN